MKNKWLVYLHSIRKEEIDIAFSTYNLKQFDNALELGAGDGYQSKMILKYCKKITCTELNSERLIINKIDNIKYKICDAEIIDSYFDKNQFDLVFSSNMFEHLPNPINALNGIKKILTKDGIAILIMPSPFWSICHIFLYYPVTLFNVIKRRLFNKKNIIKSKKKINTENNLKLKKIKRFSLLDLIKWPHPHGVSKSHFKELLYFKKKSWVNMYIDSGYEVIDIKKGPLTSGYGLNFNCLRNFFKAVGFTSEYIYYIKFNK